MEEEEKVEIVGMFIAELLKLFSFQIGTGNIAKLICLRMCMCRKKKEKIVQPWFDGRLTQGCVRRSV